MKFIELNYIFNNLINNLKNDNSSIFIIKAYNNVFKKLTESYSANEIVTVDKINNLQITDNMKKKLLNIYKNPPNDKKIKAEIEKNKLMYDLKNYLGIGDKKIQELIGLGIKDIKDLKKPKWFNKLPAQTQYMILYKPIKKIAYEQIKLIENKLKSMKSKNCKIEIVGSYRRKKKIIKDIDIMISSSNKNIVDKYINYLDDVFGNVYIYSKGANKVSLMINPFADKKIKYKLDIFRTEPKYYYTMLLYSTGSKDFNVNMRNIAKKQNKLLNQYGLYYIDPSTKKVTKINTIKDDEKKIFKILGMEYISPENRT